MLAAPDEQKRLGGLDLVKKQAEADTEHRDEWLALLTDISDVSGRENLQQLPFLSSQPHKPIL